MIIVAIGSETCTELYKNSPIEMTNDGFIKVNQYLETSVKRVLAVGDISKYPLRVFNLDSVNCQHWQMACSTGHQAGRHGYLLIKNKCCCLYTIVLSDLRNLHSKTISCSSSILLFIR